MEEGYIATVSTGGGETEITEGQYNELLSVIRGAPKAPEGYVYRLRADTLTWELDKRPESVPEPEESEADAADYESALSRLGVEV